MEAYLKSHPDLGDERRRSLRWASFRDQRSYDQEDWDKRMTFWKKILWDASEKGLLGENLLSIEADHLDEKFSYRGMMPLGIPVVLKTMEAERELVKIEKFQGNNTTWISWGVNTFVAKPLWWGISMTGLWKPDTNPKGLYVLYARLKKVADSIYDSHQAVRNSLVENIMDIDEFYDQYSGAVYERQKLSRRDIQLVISQLQKEKKIVVRHALHTTLIRFLTPKKISAGVASFSDTDQGIYSLKKLFANLQNQIQDLEQREAGFTSSASQQLQNKNRERALIFLKKRKIIRAEIQKREAILSNVEEMLFKIRSAETNALALDAYEVGKATLVEASKKLNIDSIDNVVDDVRDLFVQGDEIDVAIAQDFNANKFDDEELERELEAVAREEQQEKDFMLQPIPNVPNQMLNMNNIPATSSSSSSSSSSRKVQMVSQTS